MVICGSYMPKFDVSKELKKKLTMIKEKGGGIRESGGAFMF